MSEKAVLLSKDGGIATITLNRPEAMNSMNQALVNDLNEALRVVENDTEVRVIVLTGNGRAFCAGGDLFYLQSLNSPTVARNFIAQAGTLISTIMGMEKPIIAMVNGVAAGAGFNIALACDIVFCAKTARFGQSFSKVGLVPDCGGLYLLPMVVGMHKAKELMFTADLINADSALNLRIVNQVVDDAALKETTYKFAERLANSASVSLGMIKKIVNRINSLTLENTLEFETNLQTICMQTEDHKEGVNAFKEKRAPNFKGK